MAFVRCRVDMKSTTDTMFRISLIGALFAIICFTALAAGIDRAAMDMSVAPGDDFWTYANGAHQGD